MSAFSPDGWTPIARPTGNDRIELLLDRAEIHDALMRYLRGVDRGDAQLIASAYQPDAIDDRGPFSQAGGEVIAVDILRRLGNHARVSTHTICNELIEVNGDNAISEAYCIAYHRLVDETTFRVFAGRYFDEWERREDRQWRIAHRVVINEWGRISPLGEQAAEWDLYAKGSKSRTDVSYVHL